MTAETIAKFLGGRKAGGGWMVRCPVHDDREPSLSIRDGGDGKVLVHCHAGCDQGRVIAALRSRGFWNENAQRRFTSPARRAAAKNQPCRDNAKRTKAALSIWQSAAPADGTLVETYLRSRGIVMPIPAALRFHGGTKHARGKFWPAMIALVTRGTDGAPLAIHRTYLARDGACKAPVDPQKMMLGPCRGGAVRLGPITDRLLVAEGIENALSAMQATGQAAWAALSTSGLRTLELPVDAGDVVVLADGDEPGEAAAHDAARRWKRCGRRVRIARPPRGFDFNDVLLGRTFGHVEGAA